jgi:asparagine synthase (glutamine-hydrolysing)
MKSEDGVVSVFNGEIYNIEELRSRLRPLNYTFRTRSDTEILLQGYRAFGDEIVQQICGMFAFAIWDARCKRLLLARDRWGEKPLYIAPVADGLVFASEVKALRPWQGVDWDVQFEDIHVFLRHGYLPGARTGWRGIHKLLPGQMLVWEHNKQYLTRYVQAPLPRQSEKQKVDLIDAAHELRYLISKAVQERLISDRPIGAFLSGGIDSSTVLGSMSRHITQVRTFSIRWQEQDYTEEVYAREVSRHFGTQHTEILCTPEYLCANFDYIAGSFDELFGDESMIPTALLAEVAKKQVDVVLAGDGADELFGGYQRYHYNKPFDEYLDVFSATANTIMRRLYAPGFAESFSSDEEHMIHYREAEHLDLITAKRWVDLHTYLPCDILTKVDRMTMRVALESRAPFLDPQLSEWAMRCTPELIGSGAVTKRILKVAVADLLPQSIVERPKMGFGVPLVHWFRGPLAKWVEERLVDGSLLGSEWILITAVRKLVDEHKSGLHNHYRTLFNLLVLEAWLKRENLDAKTRDNSGSLHIQPSKAEATLATSIKTDTSNIDTV